MWPGPTIQFKYENLISDPVHIQNMFTEIGHPITLETAVEIYNTNKSITDPFSRFNPSAAYADNVYDPKYGFIESQLRKTYPTKTREFARISVDQLTNIMEERNYDIQADLL